MQPIEFIVDPPAGEAAEPAPPRERRRRLPWIAAATVLAAGVGLAVVRDSSGTPSTPPAQVVHLGLPAGPEVTEVPSKVHAPSAAAGCTAAVCRAGAVVLPVIRAAVSHYLKGSTGTTVTTTVRLDSTSGDQELVSRVIDAHVGPVDVLIRIKPYLHPEPVPTVGISPTPPGLGSAFFRFVSASYVVDVQWTGTQSTPPPSGALQDLADDPRLETLA